MLRNFVGAVTGLTGATLLAGCLPGSDGTRATTAVSDWLAESDASKGIVDHTGRAETTVDVGVDDGLAFGPPAIRVDTGTTVIWEWTGKGGRHNVVARDGAFESPYYETEGQSYERTVSTPGQVLYYCEPHRELGMRGAVVVREP